jgi:hypothetical protein
MNNVFCFDRSQLAMLKGKLSRRLSGSCLSIMRLFCLEANHTDGLVFGREAKRGQIFAGRSAISQQTGLSQKTVRNAIGLLHTVGELASEGASDGTLYTIVNYDLYDGLTKKGASQGANKGPARGQQGANQGASQGASDGTLYPIANYDLYDGLTEKGASQGANKGPARGEKGATSKEVQRKKERTRQTCETTLEAGEVLAKWIAIAPLPESADPSRALEVLDELRRIDGLDWDRIERICEYAAREWVPKGYIGTAAALRQWTSSRDMKKWEAIERQVQTREANFGRPGDPAGRPHRAAVWRPRRQKYVCCDPAGNPWTGRTRMRLMELYYPDATQDPDQGHDFTIPDEQMPANRRKVAL